MYGNSFLYEQTKEMNDVKYRPSCSSFQPLAVNRITYTYCNAIIHFFHVYPISKQEDKRCAYCRKITCARKIWD